MPTCNAVEGGKLRRRCHAAPSASAWPMRRSGGGASTYPGTTAERALVYTRGAITRRRCKPPADGAAVVVEEPQVPEPEEEAAADALEEGAKSTEVGSTG